MKKLIRPLASGLGVRPVKGVTAGAGDSKAPPKELVESIEKFCGLLVVCVAIAAYAIMRSTNYDRAVEAVAYAEHALAAIHAIKDFDNLPHRDATIRDSHLFQQMDDDRLVFSPSQYCYSPSLDRRPEIVSSCKAWQTKVLEQEKDLPAGRVFVSNVESPLGPGRICTAAIIKGLKDISTQQIAPGYPTSVYTQVPGSLTYLVVVECGGNFHKEAFIVADGRTSSPPTFVLKVEAKKYPSIIDMAPVFFPADLDNRCVTMTDMYRLGLPQIFVQALDWTRICYFGDAASMMNDFVTRSLANALQTAIPRGDVETTMTFARESFIGESNRTIQLEFSSLKVNFRDAVLINCIVACFICLVLYVRSIRLSEFNAQSVAPSVLLDHDTIIARAISALTLIFLCVAPVVCMASVVIFDKIGLVVPGPEYLADLANEVICRPLGTSCGPNHIATVSVTMTAAAGAGFLSEIFTLLAAMNFQKYITRTLRFTRASRRIATARPRFFDRVRDRERA